MEVQFWWFCFVFVFVYFFVVFWFFFCFFFCFLFFGVFFCGCSSLVGWLVGFHLFVGWLGFLYWFLHFFIWFGFLSPFVQKQMVRSLKYKLNSRLRITKLHLFPRIYTKHTACVVGFLLSGRTFLLHRILISLFSLILSQTSHGENNSIFLDKLSYLKNHSDPV